MISDTSLERDETFDLALNIPSSAGRGITLGSRSTALGVIIDSTSKCHSEKRMLYTSMQPLV